MLSMGSIYREKNINVLIECAYVALGLKYQNISINGVCFGHFDVQINSNREFR